ncbi:competence protein CoiA family protein [Burkholderia sp. 3C]
MKIPFAVDSSGRIIDIQDVPPPAPGSFKCAVCKREVIRKQGEKRIWHFAHKVDSDCTGTSETALHKLAKQTLVESSLLHVPAAICTLDDESDLRSITLRDAKTLRWDEPGEAEVTVATIRPDFRGVCNGEAIFVEVTVTHKPEKPKLEVLRRLQVPTLEIDLSSAPRDATAHEIRNLVLSASERKRWAFYPGQVEAIEELNRMQRQRDLEAYDELVREEQEERRLNVARTEAHADKLAEIFKRTERIHATFRALPPRQKLEFLEDELGKPAVFWPAILGQSVRGADAIRVPSRIWQADVFREYILGRKSRGALALVKLEEIADWLHERYEIPAANSRPVRVALWHFLSGLERADYLSKLNGQQFKVLRDRLGDESRIPTLEEKARIQEEALRGCQWSSRKPDIGKFRQTVRDMGIFISPGVERDILLELQEQATCWRYIPESYAKLTAWRIELPVELVVGLLTSAGVFVRHPVQ